MEGNPKEVDVTGNIPDHMREIIDRILDVSADIRYVAVYRDGQRASRERGGLSGASSTESDRYEELLVNPTLLTLVRQRGDIDCGGAMYVLVRYGNFFQLIIPVSGGHVSLAIEPRADPLTLLGQVRNVLVAAGLLK